ncbi:MAG: N-acetyltransferase [Chloroflexota bacterium]|nr:MAG: N-acetyltransferase [Chloroflexota bacterium]
MIKFGKVVLRKKRREDAAKDYAWRKDPEIARYDATVPLGMSFGEFLSNYDLELQSNGYRRQRYAIETTDGNHIGNITYYNIDLQRKEAELGIVIGERAYWGRGYGSDAVLGLLSHIFSNTPIERVYLRTLDWNTRARRAFAHCGFKEMDRGGPALGRFVVMEIYREEFNKMMAARRQSEKDKTA